MKLLLHSTATSPPSSLPLLFVSSSVKPFFPLLSTHAAARPRTGKRLILLARASFPLPPLDAPPCTTWIVVVDIPPGVPPPPSREDVVDYYVATLAKVLGSARDAQASIYHASLGSSDYGFCCHVDEEASGRLARLPEVLSIRRDTSPESNKDYGFSRPQPDKISRSGVGYAKFSPSASGAKCDHWLVRMEKPDFEVVTKAQMVDYYARILTKTLGNLKDAEVSMYNISWEKNFGFCCHIAEDRAKELADVPGVLSVCPDHHIDSDNKDYGGTAMTRKDMDSVESTTNVTSKRLFVTGLSFYTSEKTLRAAFESFGELVEVQVVMDKISKRSKGYAFIEYTTEAAAGAALQEMNGKIINGWMIVVAEAKKKSQRTAKGHYRSLSNRASST